MSNVMTTPQCLFRNATEFGDLPALSVKDDNGEWVIDTWSDVLKDTLAVARALLALGFEKNELIRLFYKHTQ